MFIFNNPGVFFPPEKIISNILPSQRLLFSLYSKSLCVGDGRGLFHVLVCEVSVSEVWGVFCCFIFFVEQISSAALWQNREGRTVPVWSTNGLPLSRYLGPSAWMMVLWFTELLDQKNAALSTSDEWAPEVSLFFFFFFNLNTVVFIYRAVQRLLHV